MIYRIPHWALLLFNLLVLLAAIALAHPGRLNEHGCHRVSEDWRYKDGRILKAGTEHCHRGLGEMKLDGKEMLEDPKDEGEPRRPKMKVRTE